MAVAPAHAQDAVAAAVSEQALVQMLNSLAVTDQGANVELQRVVGTIHTLFQSMSDTIQKQNTTITARSTELETVKGKIKDSEVVHKAEMTALTQRMDAALNALRAEIKSLKSQIQTTSTSLSGSQSGLSALGTRLSSVQSSLQAQITNLSASLQGLRRAFDASRDNGREPNQHDT